MGEIAVGDLDPDPDDEVVLTTVNGDLVIYDLVVENGQLALGGPTDAPRRTDASNAVYLNLGR